MILTIRTDKPQAEIGLFDADATEVEYHTWEAGRQLAKDLHKEIHELLQRNSADWPDITGLVVFQGPGSFTGLRIGITVVNSLAYSLTVPIAATQGEAWIEDGLQKLAMGRDDKVALPRYGAEAHITPPKK